MTDKLIQESCENFAELLASKTSVPGGGGAAAFAGALGVALCSMVGNFTIGKKKYADVEEDIRIILEKAETIRLELLDLVDEDARAFAPLAEAYGISKDDPKRSEIIEAATLNACDVPIKIIKYCTKAIDLFSEILEKGNRMLISDVGCGALMCRASMECAAMNVFINTGTLKDREKANSIEKEVDEALKKYYPMASEIAEKVNKIIRKRDV